MTYVIGIDPGLHGALALLEFQSGDPHPTIHFARDMPLAKVRGKDQLELGVLAGWLCEPRFLADEPHVWIEDVHAAPGQGVSSMFRFGYAAGAITGLVVGLGLAITQITPQRWQHIAGVGDKGPDAARHRAGQLFPRSAQLFERKMDHNRADAALIAFAGWHSL